MRFVSTRGAAPPVSFRDALFSGLAPDGGLYMPEAIEPLSAGMLSSLRGASLAETATAVVAPFIGEEMPRATLQGLLVDALSFSIPLVGLHDGMHALELFHGPTLAFKDVGARVMARLMAHFYDGRAPLTVLVATSGDTGSAVAQAFFGVQGTRVVVLYPEGQVSPVQEAQFSTLGGNVTAVAVAGTFDDCQRLAKQAFGDAALRAHVRLTSANSINIGRLLPQMVYYLSAALSFAEGTAVMVSVPSGNFGNLTAGLMAQRLGAPIRHFVAATTVNDTVPRYLATGRYTPRPSVPTLANAMDVGDPSNAERMRWLFDADLAAMRHAITPSVHTDDEVRGTIRDVWQRTGYLCDPHTAIAYLGLRRTVAVDWAREFHLVFLATAHPAKFREVVEPVIDQPIPLPPALEEALHKPRSLVRMAPELSELWDVLDGGWV